MCTQVYLITPCLRGHQAKREDGELLRCGRADCNHTAPMVHYLEPEAQPGGSGCIQCHLEGVTEYPLSPRDAQVFAQLKRIAESRVDVFEPSKSDRTRSDRASTEQTGMTSLLPHELIAQQLNEQSQAQSTRRRFNWDLVEIQLPPVRLAPATPSVAASASSSSAPAEVESNEPAEGSSKDKGKGRANEPNIKREQR